ncbi:hypothetical protein VNO80_10708 [Phaseolus coccineus]|uniref:Uncharacterized protein n=1 Tax=Phaseolus coccineus TaxID=3886 RepID=A0AAN9N8X2_PHACN
MPPASYIGSRSKNCAAAMNQVLSSWLSVAATFDASEKHNLLPGLKFFCYPNETEILQLSIICAALLSAQPPKLIIACPACASLLPRMGQRCSKPEK